MSKTVNQVSHKRFKIFLAVLVAGVAALAPFAPINYVIALAFDCAAIVFLISTVTVWRRGTSDEMRKNAARDDGGRIMLLIISTIVIGVILAVLVTIIGEKTSGTFAGLPFVIVTQLLAWIFANVVWAFHYAHLYYDRTEKGDDQGGLSFPGGAEPEFSDFCYFSMVIGMTFQVSDVEVTSPRFRKIVMAHGMVAFLYNLGVLALTVNLIAGAL